MEYRVQTADDSTAIARLFRSVFTDSEGEREGALIGNLAQEMLASTDHHNLFGYVAIDAESIIGAILFSRLAFEAADINVFILSPVAVDTAHQGMGYGQALIAHGLQEIVKQDVRFAVTYGDPAFYSKVGFYPISQDAIAPPLKLSQPEGWLGQSLSGAPLQAIPGRCSCVAALDDPVYW